MHACMQGEDVNARECNTPKEEVLTQHSDSDERLTTMSELTERSDIGDDEFDPVVMFYV